MKGQLAQWAKTNIYGCEERRGELEQLVEEENAELRDGVRKDGDTVKKARKKALKSLDIALHKDTAFGICKLALGLTTKFFSKLPGWKRSQCHVIDRFYVFREESLPRDNTTMGIPSSAQVSATPPGVKISVAQRDTSTSMAAIG
ncbi:hypothetical protein EV426DRAFT_705371 [Tirmania nivea]|nr:hypothetical protein EV426DRAFT_705371 [Tirmania nivea]